MNLVIFDIDGTLANSQEIEDHCFKTAFLETLGIDIWSVAWHTLQHVTDWGISKEICQKEMQREISESELATFRVRFIHLLEKACEQDPNLFTEVPGSSSFFQTLHRHPDYEVAIATGSWSDSARIKLEAIGVPYKEVPLASSDHFISREDIVQDAIKKSRDFYAASFESTIYFGDGAWDLKTCQNIAIPFIGVDCNRSGKLKQLGAPHVIHDYLDQRLVFEIMDTVL